MRLRNVKGSREQIAANEYTIKDAERLKASGKIISRMVSDSVRNWNGKR